MFKMEMIIFHLFYKISPGLQTLNLAWHWHCSADLCHVKLTSARQHQTAAYHHDTHASAYWHTYWHTHWHTHRHICIGSFVPSFILSLILKRFEIYTSYWIKFMLQKQKSIKGSSQKWTCRFAPMFIAAFGVGGKVMRPVIDQLSSRDL